VSADVDALWHKFRRQEMFTIPPCLCMIHNFFGFFCRNVHVECPFLTFFQLLNYILSDDFLLGRSAVTAAGPLLPPPLFRSCKFHFLWYIFRNGILKRHFWTRFMGINSSLLRSEFFVLFSIYFFLLNKMLFMNRLEFPCFFGCFVFVGIF
jgi:hypothetical protein